MLKMIRDWEELFVKLYRRKPRMIEREQFMIGVLVGVEWSVEEVVRPQFTDANSLCPFTFPH